MPETSSRARTVRVILTWTSVTVGVAAIFLLLAGGAVATYAKLYENRIYPGVKILGVRLEGLSKTEARKVLQDKIDSTLAGGLRFRYHGKEVTLDATTVSSDPDASRDLLRYDIDKALDAAYALGRSHGWEANLFEQVRLRIVPSNLDSTVRIDRKGITDALNTLLAENLMHTRDASFELNASSEPPTFRILAERKGAELETDAALDQLAAQARSLDLRPIEIRDHSVTPDLTVKDLEPLIGTANEILSRPALSFTYQKHTYAVPRATIAQWVSVTGTRGAYTVALDPQRFASDIKTIASDIEVDPKNGSLQIVDGKIASFTAGTEGTLIDTDATFADVAAHWPASTTLPLIVTDVRGSLLGEDPDRLGIKELIGVGTSNFSGSPPERRKNIAHGIRMVNGSIIQDGETFSLVTVLGDVDGAHGWTPALVIKGNETTPGFGGGLCQIGTTTFRAAMASGLPIVERQNHSYRVRYYEPAGTDATIYGPHPDLRFLNDTGHAILINAYSVGDNAYFEFWGTKDGRKAEQTYPHIYNVVAPPPMKLVETLDLPPGKKNCTETAHAGADADFTYTVTYPNGDVKTKVFRSHYRPWQAVCLVGVTALTKPADTATDTPLSPDSPDVPVGTTTKP